jgi:hypothetical protein
MVDVILFSFAVGVFYGGFYCGAKFGTLKVMWQRAAETVKGWL